ncbi:MAG: hypothetical protein JWN78_1810 [Bacteroidota bacterium]|nr:hypothetical protein [Bacteroidota bacterium]
MKVLKWILIAGVALLLAGVISTFFMSENFRISQTQIIKASPEAVYDQLATPKNWKNWSYWQGLDDKMAITYNDIPSGEGASYSWKSEKKSLGSGSFIIVHADPNQYILGKLTFDGHGDATSEYILKPVEGGTEVTSAMNSETKGIFSKLMGRVMMKPMMAKAFKASADKMSTYLESNPAVAKKGIDSVSLTARDCTAVPAAK